MAYYKSDNFGYDPMEEETAREKSIEAMDFYDYERIMEDILPYSRLLEWAMDHDAFMYFEDEFAQAENIFFHENFEECDEEDE